MSRAAYPPPFGISHETPASINLLLPPPSYRLDLYEDHPHATGAARQEENSVRRYPRGATFIVRFRSASPGPQGSRPNLIKKSIIYVSSIFPRHQIEIMKITYVTQISIWYILGMVHHCLRRA